ncbi:hypothetical protein BDZ89DRAFT_433685 [Hymenopellis radicata]|nr:hypothetical protein BDZ89DRAFT_433685 [Hymenopellis radicata]
MLGYTSSMESVDIIVGRLWWRALGVQMTPEGPNEDVEGVLSSTEELPFHQCQAVLTCDEPLSCGLSFRFNWLGLRAPVGSILELSSFAFEPPALGGLGPFGDGGRVRFLPVPVSGSSTSILLRSAMFGTGRTEDSESREMMEGAERITKLGQTNERDERTSC